MKKILASAFCFLLISQLTACSNIKETAEISTTEQTTQAMTEATSVPTTEAVSEYDTLRKLYVDFPQTASYQEALSFIQESGLPYIENKMTGFITFEISTVESNPSIGEPGMVPSRDYDYIWIDYMCPKQEDRYNAELEKYIFTGIGYVPAEGTYVLESHADNTLIMMDGEMIDSAMNRQEQMHFLNSRTGPAIGQREAVSDDIETCIREKFATFEEECEILDLWYDKKESDRIIDSYMESGKGSVSNINRENVIVILSDIKTGENTASFEPNTVYTDWNWILLRENPDSEWYVDDYGNE